MPRFIQMRCEEDDCGIIYGCLNTSTAVFTFCVDCKESQCPKNKKILEGLCPKHRQELYEMRTGGAGQ